MKTGYRLIIVAVFLFGILFLARNQIAWAGNVIPQSNGIIQGQNQSVLQRDEGDREPGSVKPPPVVLPPIPVTGSYPVGGVCVLQVERLAPKVLLYASLQSFDVLEKRPKDIGRYLAGVCNVTYTKAGKGISSLESADGSVKICFAPVPKKSVKIFVYNGKTWTGLETKLENGLVCANASIAGKYILASNP